MRRKKFRSLMSHEQKFAIFGGIIHLYLYFDDKSTMWIKCDCPKLEQGNQILLFSINKAEKCGYLFALHIAFFHARTFHKIPYSSLLFNPAACNLYLISNISHRSGQLWRSFYMHHKYRYDNSTDKNKKQSKINRNYCEARKILLYRH